MVRRKHLEEKVYDYILAKINNRELLPNQHIKELDLSKELDMSRTPIRSAFKQLEKDAIIKIIPYKGARILKPQIDSSAFQERVQFLELTLTFHFHKLESKEVDYDVSAIQKLFDQLKDLVYAEDASFEKVELNFWDELLVYCENQFTKSTIMQTLRTIFLDSQPLESILRSSRKHKLKHFDQLIDYLKDNDYTHVRRELRILFNQLNLNVIQGV